MLIVLNLYNSINIEISTNYIYMGGVVIPNTQFRQTWAEINLESIAHNVRQFRQHLGKHTKIMAVVKADAYGLGAVEVSKAALSAGASQLAVAFFEEGVDLRRSEIKAQILLLGHTSPELVPLLYEYKLTPIIYCMKMAQAFSQLSSSRGCQLPVHIKIDTGMGRLGVSEREAVNFITALSKLPGLSLEGIFTHLATADEKDSVYTKKQLRSFKEVLATLYDRGINFPFCHAANSAAAAIHPDSHFNLIRLGISLYGYYPSAVVKKSPLKLIPALTLKSRIVLIKEVPPGTAIGYGCTYVTPSRSVIATVPIGYGDGYSRSLSNCGQILVQGQRVPIIGRVCMDNIMVDISNVKGIKEGEEVVIYGRQGEEEITVDEVASILGTISHEIICRIDKRVPRLYLRHGRMVSLHDLLGFKDFD